MNPRQYLLIRWFIVACCVGARPVWAQTTTGTGPTLELGEVQVQPGIPASRDALSKREVKAPDVAGKSTPGADVAQEKASAPVKSGTASAPRATSADRTGGARAEGGAAPARSKPERVEFNRHPLRISLGRSERLVTFPHPVAVSLPEGAEAGINMQNIGRTVYLTMLAPRVGAVRVLAEDLVTGHTIPLDLAGVDSDAGLSPEVEVHYESDDLPEQQLAERSAKEVPALDIVQLTRYAVQTIYAPQRLKPSSEGVVNIPSGKANLEGLFRSVRTRASLLGQWRSGDLYVTAVQLTNLERRSISLDLEQVRGRWIAAALQHRRLQAAGSDFDSTTLYLVCGQPYQSCR